MPPSTGPVACGHGLPRHYLALAALAGLAIACASGNVPPLRYQDSAGQWRESAGEVKPPVLQTRVAPAWPEELRSRENTGTVVLDVVVDREGRVGEVTVVKSLTRAMDSVAIKTVRQWRYEPATVDGTPVAVLISVTVAFELH